MQDLARKVEKLKSIYGPLELSKMVTNQGYGTLLSALHEKKPVIEEVPFHLNNRRNTTLRINWL